MALVNVKEAEKDVVKPVGYMNFRLPKDNGKTFKMSAAKFYENNEIHSQLVEAYQADPEGTIEKIKNALIIDIQLIAEESTDKTVSKLVL